MCSAWLGPDDAATDIVRRLLEWHYPVITVLSAWSTVPGQGERDQDEEGRGPATAPGGLPSRSGQVSCRRNVCAPALSALTDREGQWARHRWCMYRPAE